ncbi:MAG: serine hydrolase [Pseudomonadota bacterium]
MKRAHALAALIFATQLAHASLPEQALTRQLQAIVSDPAMPLASLSVVAIRSGAIVYSRQFGDKRLATPTSAAQPADAKTMYRVASISKLVAALGAMKLVEQGKLALDADVSDYLGYRLRNPNFPDQVISLRMLLSHQSSLLDDAGIAWDARSDMKEFLVPGGALYGKGEMWSRRAAPGRYFDYVNLNWGVIATLMERASGERFDRLMRQLILEPMGLKASYNVSAMSAADIDNIATLYRKRVKDGDETWNPNGPWIAQTDDFGVAPPLAPAGLADYVIGRNGSLFGPQGGLRISSNELAQIMLMLMDGGRYKGTQILKPETVTAMLERQWTQQGANGDSYHGLYRAWGLGSEHFTDTSSITDGKATGDRLVAGGSFGGVGHLGFSWGLKAAFVFDPKTKNGLVYVESGVGANPENQPGEYSSRARFEERITDALIRGALR